VICSLDSSCCFGFSLVKNEKKLFPFLAEVDFVIDWFWLLDASASYLSWSLSDCLIAFRAANGMKEPVRLLEIAIEFLTVV